MRRIRMSKLSDLRGQGREIEIFGTKIQLQQLNVDELAEFAQMQENKDIKKAITFLIRTTLKKSIPDATDEEINNISPQAVGKLIPELLDLNKIAEDDIKKARGVAEQNGNSALKKESNSGKEKTNKSPSQNTSTKPATSQSDNAT